MQLGPYQADAYGPVEITAAPGPEGTERVIAKASGGPCDFAPGTEVLSGEFQGHNVLVGTLLLCQEGPGCPATVSLPVLATYNSADAVLSALVRLKEGCSSRALPKGASLVVLKSTVAPGGEEEGEAPDEDRDSAPLPVVPVRAAMPEGGGSALAVAGAQAGTPDLDMLLKEGQRFLAAGNFSNAKDRFGLVVLKDKGNVDALVGLGASHLGIKDYAQGFKYLEDARQLRPLRPDVHLWLAYGWFLKGEQAKVRPALDQALTKGWKAGNPADDVPVKALEGELGAARVRLINKKQGQAGAGSPRP